MTKAVEIARNVFEHVAFSITDDSVEVYDIDMIRRVNPGIMDAIIEIQKNLQISFKDISLVTVSYTHLRAHETLS